jgi:hypothetical protein
MPARKLLAPDRRDMICWFFPVTFNERTGIVVSLPMTTGGVGTQNRRV